METFQEQNYQIEEAGNLQYIRQAENKIEIYLFKNNDESGAQITTLINYFRNDDNKSVAIIDTSDTNKFEETVRNLTENYDKVILVTTDYNFTSREVTDLSLNVEALLHEARICNGKRIIHNVTVSENLILEVAKKISENGDNPIGIKCNLKSVPIEYLINPENIKYLCYKNWLIKIWYERKKNVYYYYYFKVLTNYSFKIVKALNCDGEIKKQDIELEIIDVNGEKSYLTIPAKDKYNLSGFRKLLYPTGPFLDFMTNADFSAILNLLYNEGNYETVYIQERPGLIEDKNVYLTANEVISLEN